MEPESGRTYVHAGPVEIARLASSATPIADAGLIAAAPDLLEALEEMIRTSREIWGAIINHQGPPVLEGQGDLAREFLSAGNAAGAAIAKARGE